MSRVRIPSPAPFESFPASPSRMVLALMRKLSLCFILVILATSAAFTQYKSEAKITKMKHKLNLRIRAKTILDGDAGKDSNGAGDGIRTRDIDLGKVALYQLSYSRSF